MLLVEFAHLRARSRSAGRTDRVSVETSLAVGSRMTKCCWSHMLGTKSDLLVDLVVDVNLVVDFDGDGDGDMAAGRLMLVQNILVNIATTPSSRWMPCA